jgi:Protein of unknown function (DUF1549)/Protein of unknown function (DUF1553)/Planctomycete cytochrome C
VLPLLVASCSECHGEEKQSNELRLDSREAILKGGEHGPAIVPGKPDNSLLIEAVRQSGELEMPPDGKLADHQIAILEHWVEIGAPWPANHVTLGDEGAEAQRTQWAFQPVHLPAVPSVIDAAWIKNPIDAFISAELESHGLKPSPSADRRTLIRRISYDLTGLPPTPAEVDAFVGDADPTAYLKLVDRLLASPQYGEHWARHWLDVARYADTKGYVYAREERFFVHASAYRDWVVRAFYEDLPYDEFLVLQLAADQAAPNDRSALAAMGFLTLGRRFLGVTHDIIDDRIDVVGRGMLGLTVGCARCHDHKYDPIPTDDYYSLYGVFQNCAERLIPIAEPAERHKAYEAFDAELKKRQQSLAEAMAKAREETSAIVRRKAAAYLDAQLQLEKYPEESFNQILTKEDINPIFVRRWQAYLLAMAKADDPIFFPWRRFASLAAAEFSERSNDVVRELSDATGKTVNPLAAQAFNTPPASMRDVADRYGQIFADVEQQWRELLAKDASATALRDANAEAVRQVLYGAHSPCSVPDEPIVGNEWYFDLVTTEMLWKLQGEVERWLIQSPQAPAHAVTLVDRDLMQEPRVFRRGNPAMKGDEVPRRFLKVLSGDDRRPFVHGSGRLEMARAIASANNPLTARVWANRLWMHHFGAGLVRTPSDFGMRSDPPTHPQLLDWLASTFMSNGWSTKNLHRLIVLSAAYQQQSSGPHDALAPQQAQAIDPENRLLWRMNGRRLSFEEWRDTLLTVSDELDLTQGGRAAELFAAGRDNRRRTLYGLVDRQFLTSAMRTFDFANPDLHTPQRSETTVSQQALFAMNHAFVANRARGLVARLGDIPSADLAGRVRQLYRVVYQRDPTQAQERAAFAFLSAPPEKAPAERPETLAWQYGYGKLFEAEGRVEFHALPHFTGSAWQGGPQWPDTALGWVQLTATGGRAGNDLEHAAIRRWTAPRAGSVSIKSTATHQVAAGDGIRCWIVAPQHGVLASAVLLNRQQSLDVATLQVEAGDTVDFVVDFNANLNSDQYLWSAEIHEIAAQSSSGAGIVTNWNSSRDFSGVPPDLLDPWEQFAQVLLLANELMFVD